ncbi:MAG TPA: PE family protein [Mycolicibacillus parakoreensis]|nr:PE family protein [Mycolicibacillus parakoreensis]
MTLRILPEGVAATGAAVQAIAAQLGALHAATAPVIGVVAPPAGDPVSVRAATDLSAQGAQHAAVGAYAAAVLGRAGVGAAEAGADYAGGDALAAATYPR